MNDDIKRKIDFEKQQMEREIKDVESRNPPRPDEPSLGRAFVSGLKVFGVAFVIAALNFLFALSSEDNSDLFIVITSCAIVFGAVIAIIVISSLYSDECKALEKWESETSSYQKQAEITKIKRKYDARISNLEEYGTTKGSYSYWHHPPKVCLNCGSTNVEFESIGRPGLRSSHQICKDCGYWEFY